MKTEEIAKKVEEMIQREISFRLRKMHHEEMLKLNDKNYAPHKLVKQKWKHFFFKQKKTGINPAFIVSYFAKLSSNHNDVVELS